MIATIVIISLAFYWLLYETKYLTIRLTGFNFDYSDCQDGYDGSDCVYLDDYQKQYDDMINEILNTQAEQADFEAGYQAYRREQGRKIKPKNAGGSKWERDYNRERTREMRENKRTTAQIAYMGE